MKPRTGNLFKRGSNYYLRYKLDGTVIVRRLLDDQDNPVLKLQDAEKLRAQIMAPLRVANRKVALENIAARIGGVEATLAKMESEAPALRVADTWTAYKGAGTRKEIGAQTLRNYECCWQAFVTWLQDRHPEIVELRAVNFEIAEEYFNHLIARKLSGRSVNGHRASLRLVFNALAKREQDEAGNSKPQTTTPSTMPKARLTGNVWAKLEPRDEHTQGRRALTVAELRSVCGKATGELRVLLAFGLYLGCRLGDAATMDWGSVDLVRRIVTYWPRKTARTDKDTLKTPIHTELHAVLSEIPVNRRHGPVCPGMAEKYEAHGAEAISGMIQDHFEVCGLATCEDRRGAGVRRRVVVGYHSLRHTAVSLLRDAGVAQSISMAIAGHSNSAVHDLYTHTDAEAMRRAVAALPAMTHKGHALPEKQKPAARAARLRARLLKMDGAAVKRHLLRLLDGVIQSGKDDKGVRA
jgi:integrase